MAQVGRSLGAATFNHAITMARSPAAPGVDGRSGDHPVEQHVLALLQIEDRGEDVGTVLGHRVGVLLGLAEFVGSAGRLRNERPNSHVAGLVGEVGKLLIDDAKFVAQRLQSRPSLLQSAFDEPVSHGEESTRRRQHVT